MSKLSAFLKPVCTEKTKEIVISDRFLGSSENLVKHINSKRLATVHKQEFSPK